MYLLLSKDYFIFHIILLISLTYWLLKSVILIKLLYALIIGLFIISKSLSSYYILIDVLNIIF